MSGGNDSWIRGSFDIYLHRWVERAEKLFSKCRKRDIQWIIYSSEFLTQLARTNYPRAFAKAIQSITRSPERDDVRVISPEELRALSQVRPQLTRYYWRLYSRKLLESEARSRICNKRLVGPRLRRTYSLSRAIFVSSVVRSIASRCFNLTHAVNLHRLDTECAEPLLPQLQIYSFACINIDYTAISGRFSERIVPSVPDPINFWKIKNRLLSFGRELQNLFKTIRYTIILDFSEVQALHQHFNAGLPSVELRLRIARYTHSMRSKLSSLGMELRVWTIRKSEVSVGLCMNEKLRTYLLLNDVAYLKREPLLRHLERIQPSTASTCINTLAFERVRAYASQGIYLSARCERSMGLLVLTESHPNHKLEMLCAGGGHGGSLPILCVSHRSALKHPGHTP